MGLIGPRMVALLKPFDCDVMVYDPYLGDEEAAASGVVRLAGGALRHRRHRLGRPADHAGD